MRVSSKTDYALRTMVDLALNGDGEAVRVKDVAARQGIPQKFLVQILLALKGAGLVRSRRGKHGGYLLGRRAETIRVADVVQVTEDALLSTSRVQGDGDEKVSSVCVGFWEEIGTVLHERLSDVTIAELADRVRELRDAPPGYVI